MPNICDLCAIVHERREEMTNLVDNYMPRVFMCDAPVTEGICESCMHSVGGMPIMAEDVDGSKTYCWNCKHNYYLDQEVEIHEDPDVCN